MPSPLPDPVDLGLVHRVLVTKLRHHGDVLLASPVFTVLKRAAPAAEIDALVYAETAAMLAGHPAIAQLHLIDRDWKRQGLVRQARAERALLSALGKRRYDLIVHLTEHPRGVWLSRLLRPRYSVARHLDRAHWPWRTSFTHYYRLPRRTPRHTVECNLDSLRRIGVQPAPGDKALVLAPDSAATARVRALLAQHGVETRRFIQLHPGSRWLFKCWPAGHYAALLEQLGADGWRVVLTGAPDPRERALVDAILAATTQTTRSRVTDLGGQLSLTELAALTREARAFVGVDSAPMHIAAAVQTPVVALFGPSGDIEWAPWQVPHRIVASADHPCRPCGNDGCGGGKISECLTTLPVARVHAALTAILAETGG
ncbi:MAG TPA: putative lipopolysaccharide heptosyltransferase III [Casimicrobiaceae bacterium]|jgi:heptosyltransferase-3|nr:putative lipopolysaccharide heptosyltransferase III [Casimicrobiaceae bacterium]